MFVVLNLDAFLCFILRASKYFRLAAETERIGVTQPNTGENGEGEKYRERLSEHIL